MKSSLNALHHQYADWTNELVFYKEQLSILNSRLEEVAQKNTAQETMAMVEHFQNKFIAMNEQVDILKHDVNALNEVVLAKAKEIPNHIDEKSFVENDKMQERMGMFTKHFSDVRFAFNKFLGKSL